MEKNFLTKNAKIKFYTYANNRPDFVELQYRSLKHFMKNEFELIVFNTCPFFQIRLRKEIKKKCRELEISCLPLRVIGYNNPSTTAAKLIQKSFQKKIRKDTGISCIIDSDMFLLSQLDLKSYMTNFDVAGVWQTRDNVNYLWPGLLFLNMSFIKDKKMNFSCGEVEGERVDVGGNLYYWLKRNPNLRIRNIHHTSHICKENNNLNTLPEDIRKQYEDDFRFELYDRLFLHYGRGLNWDKMDQEYHKRKTELASFFVGQAIAGKIIL